MLEQIAWSRSITARQVYGIWNEDSSEIVPLIRNVKLLIQDGVLMKIEHYSGIEYDYEWLAPGLIDAQINGGAGLLFTATPTSETLLQMTRAHLMLGTAYYLPTVISTSDAQLQQAIESVNEAMNILKIKNILGIHAEGPYFSKAKAGIHNPRWIRDMKPHEFQTFLKATASFPVRMMTAAPEAVDMERMSTAVQQGLIWFIGHTLATESELIQAERFGAIGVTHLWNAMPSISAREPGLIPRALLNDSLWCSIIADGIHVHSTNLNWSAKLKKQRLILVSDAMPPVGSTRDDFELEGQLIRCEQGKCTNAEGTLAGAALPLFEMVWRMANFSSVSDERAFGMATWEVADLLRMKGQIGCIRIGKKVTAIAGKAREQLDLVIFEGVNQNIDIKK